MFRSSADNLSVLLFAQKEKKLLKKAFVVKSVKKFHKNGKKIDKI